MMPSFQTLVRVFSSRLRELLHIEANSDIVSEKMDIPLPEPWKTLWYTIAVLAILGMIVAGGLLLFSKNPSIEALLLIIVGLSFVALVVFVFVSLVFGKKTVL